MLVVYMLHDSCVTLEFLPFTLVYNDTAGVDPECGRLRGGGGGHMFPSYLDLEGFLALEYEISQQGQQLISESQWRLTFLLL